MGVGCGLPAWIDEAEQHEGGSLARWAALEARSECFNMERKAEIGEMWLLVRGRGGEVDISAEAKKLVRKVSSDTVPYSEWALDSSRRTFSCKSYVYYNPTVLQDILCCISHGWL